MSTCSRCGDRMNYNDETTKLTEYECPNCHSVNRLGVKPRGFCLPAV